ncbi:BTB/POZ domain-containing protein [Emericellopsis atlantica]|uniref:BTB/POZ domain-containing protein n=1 Tax=Emericellopsis atlantica TaxID=2614577 RepID=A0A9P7ZDG3_9HYPO|nr:BTB/POZ domain-containing protein [Emericellopsis atlantica]KAG9249985.1 BTB/POZ domain-containing protein [Emericellopsis atlantica]
MNTGRIDAISTAISKCGYSSQLDVIAFANSVRAFNNRGLSDVNVHLGTFELPAHSLALVAQSEYFEKILGSECKEGLSREITFSEGSLQAYWRVFEYLYTEEYSEDPCPTLDAQAETENDDELSKDLRVYSLAEYFSINGLKEHALSRFKSKISRLWVSEIFPDCIREVYGSTSDPNCDMRKAVVEVTRENRGELWVKKAYRELIHEGGDFAVDLMDELM